MIEQQGQEGESRQKGIAGRDVETQYQCCGVDVFGNK